MAREFSQKFKELSKKLAENEVQMEEVEKKLKRLRGEPVAIDIDNHQRQDHHNIHLNQPKLETDKKTDRNQNYDHLDNNDNYSCGKSPIFSVLFLKCPLEVCFDFSLTEDGIKDHLYQKHGIIQRCIATERCVRQQINFSSR